MRLQRTDLKGAQEGVQASPVQPVLAVHGHEVVYAAHSGPLFLREISGICEHGAGAHPDIATEHHADADIGELSDFVNAFAGG